MHLTEQHLAGEQVDAVTIPSRAAEHGDHSETDAMCIVAKLGKPSLFITFTCNPGAAHQHRPAPDRGGGVAGQPEHHQVPVQIRVLFKGPDRR
jgi:hypothetical protein